MGRAALLHYGANRMSLLQYGMDDRLEGVAKPIVGALVQGKPVVLEPFMQILVATWAFETALCLDKTKDQ